MKIKFWNRLITVASLMIFIVVEATAQMPPVPAAPSTPAIKPEATDDYTWWYIMLFLLGAGLVGAVIWWRKTKKLEKEIVQRQKDTQKAKSENSWESSSLDADKELEWLRKNQNLMNRKRRKKPETAETPETAALPKKPAADALPQPRKKSAPKRTQKPVAEDKIYEVTVPLPIFSMQRLELARPFALLPTSEDEDLLGAIEQTHEDYEEADEEMRELTLKVLAAFKTRNAAEALTQFALYDLSSGLRSKAVAALADFHHESVFEPILLSCADPSREVRAAAARGLFRLNFDRADAWTRIAESGEEGRMRQAARAAMEADLVQRSFDRLIHHDYKIAYEAFALTALLLKAGETESVFNAIENHKDGNVRRALLHVIKITKDQKAIDGLYSMLEQQNLPLEIREEIDRAIEEIGYVTA